MIVPLAVELGLHRVEKITVEKGRLLAGKDFTPEDDLADIEPVAQKIGERATGKGDSSNTAAGLVRSLVTIPRWRRSAMTRLRLPSVR